MEERVEAVKQLGQQRALLLELLHKAECFNGSQRCGNGHQMHTSEYTRQINQLDELIRELCGIKQKGETTDE